MSVRGARGQSARARARARGCECGRDRGRASQMCAREGRGRAMGNGCVRDCDHASDHASVNDHASASDHGDHENGRASSHSVHVHKHAHFPDIRPVLLDNSHSSYHARSGHCHSRVRGHGRVRENGRDGVRP